MYGEAKKLHLIEQIPKIENNEYWQNLKLLFLKAKRKL